MYTPHYWLISFITKYSKSPFISLSEHEAWKKEAWCPVVRVTKPMHIKLKVLDGDWISSHPYQIIQSKPVKSFPIVVKVSKIIIPDIFKLSEFLNGWYYLLKFGKFFAMQCTLFETELVTGSIFQSRGPRIFRRSCILPQILWLWDGWLVK